MFEIKKVINGEEEIKITSLIKGWSQE